MLIKAGNELLLDRGRNETSQWRSYLNVVLILRSRCTSCICIIACGAEQWHEISVTSAGQLLRLTSIEKAYTVT